MTPRSVTTGAIDAYLKIVRRPIDMVIRFLPGQKTGAGATARVVADRVDAAARSGLASTIGADGLTIDARQRQAAAGERERALNLRREAEQREAQAETRVETSHEQAAQRRERAQAKAGAKRRTAAEKEQARTRQAAEAERKRTQASRKQEAKSEQRIESEAAREQLPAVEAQADALNERELASARRQEAERLGEAAARVKEERKEPSNGTSPA
jgi:hypothetical protein